MEPNQPGVQLAIGNDIRQNNSIAATDSGNDDGVRRCADAPLLAGACEPSQELDYQPREGTASAETRQSRSF